ncbi:MAG: SAM-dependent methyltransferase [Coraliomargaritaceae bacterium]
MNIAINLAERRILSDTIVRYGIRRRLSKKIRTLEQAKKSSAEWVAELEEGSLAEDTDAANEQHYELPAEYFRTVLGLHLKYSSGYWADGCHSLEQSESAMLGLTCERAELENGQKVLELGCGWGSLSLWMAQHYPESQFTAVSNSNSQREYIVGQAKERGLSNLEVITCNINTFQPTKHFDRVVSVEMFEHVRNHRALFTRIHDWLKSDGKLFVHIFAHREHSYLYDASEPGEWMSRYFFTGGIMPAIDLLPTAAEKIFSVEADWPVNGRHYSKTLEAWLEKQDACEPQVLEVLRDCYGEQNQLWLQRWRMFYMACSELFAFNNGNEWMVMHYRFAKK